MAFDALQRQLRGVDMLPTDSIPYSRVKRGAVFVLHALAEQKGLVPQDLVTPLFATASALYLIFAPTTGGAGFSAGY